MIDARFVGVVAMGLLALAGFLLIVIYFGNKVAARGRARGRILGQRQVQEEDEALRLGLEYTTSLTTCPRCKQTKENSVIGSSQDGGGTVDLHYCDEVFHHTQYIDWPVTSEMYRKTRSKLLAVGRRRRMKQVTV